MSDKGKVGVEAVEKALKILQCFDGGDPALSLAKLNQQTGLHKSTILRSTASLEKYGYLVRGNDSLYRLGAAVGRLGTAYQRTHDIGVVVRPELSLLSEATQETASFFVREGAYYVCLHRSEPMREIRHIMPEGTRFPLSQGASGRVLSAGAGFCGCAAELELVVSIGERDPEVAAIAAPIIDASMQLRGALSLSGPVGRFTKTRMRELRKALVRSQMNIIEKIK